MPLATSTKELLRYLRDHPGVRSAIKAPRDRTLLYAGAFFRPVWKEIAERQRTDPALRGKVTLPAVLGALRPANAPHPTLLAWAQAIDRTQTDDWRHNGFVVWRALSGLYAANAEGAVSFCVGAGVSATDKVFAATEIGVLARNPAIDAQTRDILAWLQRCLADKRTALNFGFIAG